MGAVIGHEISHSFDNQGAEFDAQGRLTHLVELQGAWNSVNQNSEEVEKNIWLPESDSKS
jgi:predicted metalloendopeptidase